MSTKDIPDPPVAQPEHRRDAEPATLPVDRPAAEVRTDEARYESLFANEETAGYRARWEAIQTGFVDQPRTAVEQADALVSEVLSKLSDVFSRERTTLEQHWQKGQENTSTEDLRMALKRYRAFFDRLLSI